MICRIKIYVESPNIRSCEDCDFNVSQSGDLITVNRQNPGPAIQICQNDILVVDVVNKIPGHSLTMHWRGQPNQEAPYMDGVPLVTQCPIPSYTTFQYKFRALAPGTHLYHAFSDSDRSRGLFGALVVRQSDKMDPQRKYYDTDSKSHIILIAEADKKLLINGKGPSHTGAALSIFTVKSNKRYRFRAAFAGGGSACPVTLTVDNHKMKIITVDGNPVNPNEADSIVLGKGERVDFVLKTNQPADGYFLRVRSCKGEGLALVNYQARGKARGEDKNESDREGRSFDTGLCDSQIGRMCLRDVKALQKMPEKLRTGVGKVMYLSFGSRIVNVNGETSDKWVKRESGL
jgi:laccase